MTGKAPEDVLAAQQARIPLRRLAGPDGGTIPRAT